MHVCSPRSRHSNRHPCGLFHGRSAIPTLGIATAPRRSPSNEWVFPQLFDPIDSAALPPAHEGIRVSKYEAYELKGEQSMTSIRTFLSVAIAAAVVFALSPRAKADEWNQRTQMTFGQPVEVPGMVLSPGTYTFKLLDSLSDRNIVQIFNKDQSHLYTTILAIPDYRLQPTGKTVVTFEERAKGSPQAIRAWFYPGDNFGQEFVYPKVRATQLASLNRQTVPAEPEEAAVKPTPEKMKQIHVTAVTPEKKEVELAQAIPPKPASPPPAAAPAPKETELPHTESPLPLIALIGFVSLAAAAGLGLASRYFV